MEIVLSILLVIAMIAIISLTRDFWDRPKDTVDMLEKFDTIVKKGLSMGKRAKIIELRENFVKVGVRDKSGEKAYMVKQRPHNEFRVIYICEYDKEYKDMKLEHVYPDSTDQNEILAQFEKEIEEKRVRR